MLFETVRDNLAKQFEIDPETITVETNIVDDLGADSLASVELAMALEEAVGVKIEDSALAEMKTVGDVLKYLESHNA